MAQDPSPYPYLFPGHNRLLDLYHVHNLRRKVDNPWTSPPSRELEHLLEIKIWEKNAYAAGLAVGAVGNIPGIISTNLAQMSIHILNM